MSSVLEMNAYLFDELEIIEEALALAREEGAVKTTAYLEKKKRYVERKLYQKPPLYEEGM